MTDQENTRPATSAASEGEGAFKPLFTAVDFADDYNRAKPDAKKSVKDFILDSELRAIHAALASPPVSEREREAIDRLKKGIWTGEKDSTTVNMCDLNDALAVIRRFTAQPQEPV